jgi:hypothetical protein
MHPSSPRVALNWLSRRDVTTRAARRAAPVNALGGVRHAGNCAGNQVKRNGGETDAAPSCPYNGSINNGTRTTSMRTTGSSGSMALLTEYDDATARELRSLRLESTEDGKGILLIEVDERKPGIHREVRYEITPAELIAAIRAHGAELPGEQHNHRQ